MKLTATIVFAFLLCAGVTAAAVADTSRVDRINAARACTALRASNSTAFATQYASFAGCVSKWAQTARTARIAARTACTSKRLHERKLRTCIRGTTANLLSGQVTAAKNAANACAAQLAGLGSSGFEQRYGENHNLRNAFGKCVSHPNTQTGSGHGDNDHHNQQPQQQVQHYRVTLKELNDSGVSGSGQFALTQTTLHTSLTIRGLGSGQSHLLTIRGLPSGSATCPTATADTNHDHLINLSEGQPSFGNALVTLDPGVLASDGRSMSIPTSLLPLQTRTIVVQGGTANGTYDPTLPVACGTITLK